MNNDIFKNNITVLQKYNPELYKRIKGLKLPENFFIQETRTDNCFTLSIKRGDGASFLLHSKYNPLNEAKTIIDRFIDDYYDIIFIGGIGCGYLPLYLLENKKENFGNIVVIEKDINIFLGAMYCINLEPLLKDNRVSVLFEQDGDIPELNDILLNNISKKTYTLIHSASYKMYPEFYDNLKNLIDSYLSRKNINIATLSRFQNLWIKNIFKNKNLFISHRGINELKNKLEGKPALVISAGPSLAENLDLIRENQDKFVIITVDSAFQVLSKNNIKSDFVVTVDPQFINYKYFEYNSNFESIMIAEPSTFPLILSKYKGKILFFSSVFPYVKWLERYSGEKGEIDMGGSVSTTAFDFAYRFNMEPIIMIGQDLAFIKNRTHTKGSYVEKYWALRYSKYNTSLNGVYKYIHNNLFIKIKSNTGGMVETDKRLMIFLVWFNNKLKNLKGSKIRVYNTSLQGAYINNTIVKPFKDILKHNKFKIIEKNFNINDVIHNDDLKNIVSQIYYKENTEISKNLKTLKNKIKTAVSLSERLYELIKYNKRTQEVNDILTRLDKIDGYINNNSEITDFLSTVIQDVIYTVLEEYETELTEEEKNNNDLKVARRSVLLYNGILKSIELYSKLFQIYPVKNIMK